MELAQRLLEMECVIQVGSGGAQVVCGLQGIALEEHLTASIWASYSLVFAGGES